MRIRFITRLQFFIIFSCPRLCYPVYICSQVGTTWDSVRFEGVFPRNSAENSTCFQVKPVKRTTLHIHLLQSEFRGVRDAEAQLDLGLAVLRVRPGVREGRICCIAMSQTLIE